MTASGRQKFRRVPFAWLLVSAGVLIFLAANTHLVYVAFQSQPNCVAHSRDAGDGHGFRAAKSSC